MSALKGAWIALACQRARISRGDAIYYVETEDPRVAIEVRVVVGAVVDGRPDKPGVFLVALTSRKDAQELGISHREQALTVAMALESAWEGVLVEALSTRDLRAPRTTGQERHRDAVVLDAAIDLFEAQLIQEKELGVRVAFACGLVRLRRMRDELLRGTTENQDAKENR